MKAAKASRPRSPPPRRFQATLRDSAPDVGADPARHRPLADALRSGSKVSSQLPKRVNISTVALSQQQLLLLGGGKSGVPVYDGVTQRSLEIYVVNERCYRGEGRTPARSCVGPGGALSTCKGCGWQ